MRKYFLTTAVALLSATSVNADNSGYINLTTFADIILPTRVSCSFLNFGTIYIAKTGSGNNSLTISMDTNGTLTSGDGMYRILSYDGASAATCSDMPENITFSTSNNTLKLNEYITIKNFKVAENKITADLYINDVEANIDSITGSHNATLPLMFTYE